MEEVGDELHVKFVVGNPCSSFVVTSELVMNTLSEKKKNTSNRFKSSGMVLRCTVFLFIVIHQCRM